MNTQELKIGDRVRVRRSGNARSDMLGRTGTVSKVVYSSSAGGGVVRVTFDRPAYVGDINNLLTVDMAFFGKDLELLSSDPDPQESYEEI